MNTFKTEGVVLKRINFGEADRIITLYTKHFGKITCLAKGIRKITSRKRGNLEIFNQVTFFAARGKGMNIITETETINAFASIRKKLKKIASAYEICEITDRLTAENSEQEEVYLLLTRYLKKLDESQEQQSSALANDFGENLLKILGFWPRGKEYPEKFIVSTFIEDIIENKIKSKNFFNKV